MITTTQMYFLLRLDQLSSIIQGFFVVSAIIFIIFNGLLFISKVEKVEEDDSLLIFIKKRIKIVTIIFILSLFSSIVVPDTKEMAAIYIIPKIINNEKIQDIGNKSLDIGNDLLELTKKYIEENLKNETKN